jgi:hypothetical protein
LGAEAAQILSQKSVLFGKDNSSPCLSENSMFYDTPVGVMLIGSVKQSIQNIQFLPNLNYDSFGKPNCFPLESSKGNVLNDKINDGITIGSIVTDEITTNFSVLNDQGEIIESELQKAAENVIFEHDTRHINYSKNEKYEQCELDKELVQFVLDDTKRLDDGRLQMPLMWNGKVAHLLGQNKNLAKKVLLSNLRKIKSHPGYLKMIDDNIKEQVSNGTIEVVPNISSYLQEHPECSFLPHMAVFKPERETTK